MKQINNQKNQKSMQPQHHERCDRRTSRAARTLVMNKTLPILLQQETNARSSLSTSLSHHEQMKTYQEHIHKLMKNADTCILNPSRDMFWKEEFEYMTQKYSRQITPKLHKCGLHGKTFISRYYLDLHLNNSYDGTKDGSNKICPADEICKFLGGKSCEREALSSEPFYAPGVHSPRMMNVYGIDSQNVKRSYKKKLDRQPCNATALYESRQFCLEAVDHCFTGNNDLIEKISETLCEEHTCHHHIHNLFGDNTDVRELWYRHHDEMHEVGPGLILVCFAGLFGLLWRNGGAIKSLFRSKPRTSFDLKKRKKL